MATRNSRQTDEEIEKLSKRVKELENEKKREESEKRRAEWNKKLQAMSPEERERYQKAGKYIGILVASIAGVFLLILLGSFIYFQVSAKIEENKVKKALDAQKEMINTYILENGENGVYSKVSGDYAYSLFNGKSYRFNYDNEYEASVTIQKGTVELFGIVCFDHGDFSNTAEYYGEIRIDGKSCYISFEGVKCENKCPEISSPTNCKIVGYSKGWDYSIDANDYLADVWACVRASVTLTQNTIHQWNEDLKLW